MNPEPCSYTILRSKRKTLAIEISPDARVIVRAPLRVSREHIDTFVRKNSDWIVKHLSQVRGRQAAAEQSPYGRIDAAELQKLTDLAAATIPPRVQRYAAQMGVTYGRITIRHQKTRWGSCSSKGNLNFNCLLMLTPPEAQDYVIVHELCHRKQMNHSAHFWAEVEQILPDYRVPRQWLRDHGGELIYRSRLPQTSDSNSLTGIGR